MDITSALQCLAADPSAPLDPAEVALLIAGDEYPHLDPGVYLEKIQTLADMLRPRLRGDLEERTRQLSEFLFDDQGFTGNEDQYYDPRNSYLNEVIERRLGIPLTLSLLAIAVGRRAGLDVQGVALPGHFAAQSVEGTHRVLFDPFHGGKLLSRAGCERLVRTVTGQPFQLTPSALEPPPLGAVVMRMLNNLKQIYLQAQDYARSARIVARQTELDPMDMSLRRDLGVTLVQAGRMGQAIDHLQAYLQAVPGAADQDEVSQLLRRVRSEVAKWN